MDKILRGIVLSNQYTVQVKKALFKKVLESIPLDKTEGLPSVINLATEWFLQPDDSLEYEFSLQIIQLFTDKIPLFFYNHFTSLMINNVLLDDTKPLRKRIHFLQMILRGKCKVF